MLNEEFSISSTSKFITYFIDGFTAGMKSESIAYLLGGSKHKYIGIWTLKLWTRQPSRMQGQLSCEKIRQDKHCFLFRLSLDLFFGGSCPRVVGRRPQPLFYHGTHSLKKKSLLGVL